MSDTIYKSEQSAEETEAISGQFVASKDEIIQLIQQGKIKCGFTLSALMLLISKNKL